MEIPAKQKRINLGRTKNLTGLAYGRLKVLSPWAKTNRTTFWLCECLCGNRAVIHGERLKYGQTRSCGCLQIQFAEKVIRKTRKRQKEMVDFIKNRGEQ
jgi:hypothetical protein